MAKSNVTTVPASDPVAQEKWQEQNAIKTLADRMGANPNRVFLDSLRNVAFRSPEVTNDQLMALIIVANQYKLNPFTKEIYAFPESEKRGGGIVPVVSIDGWLRIINEHPELDGLEYEDVMDDKGKPISGKCTIYRKDRKHPTVINEYFAEVKRGIDTWTQYPRRMLRWKTIIQCARVAFGFAGIYEPDEAERMINVTPPNTQAKTGAAGAAVLLANDPSRVLQTQPQVDPEKSAEDARDVEYEIRKARGEVSDVASDDNGQGDLPV
jgi:phage recombination protein Bet